MKKSLILLTTVLIIGGAAIAAVSPNLSVAIKKYKGQNYVGCIQDTQDLTKKDPSNALAYYYMAISYARIGKKDDAISAYEKVITLSTDETLVDYARKGSNCLNNPDFCKSKASDAVDSELDRFIRSGEDFSKETTDKLKQIRLEQLKNTINKEAELKSEMPTNDEIAEAVKVLARAGINPVAQNPYLQAQQAMYQNPEYMQLQMMLGNQNNNDTFANMMPFMLAQSQNQSSSNKNVSADMIKSMMMSSMLGNINTTFDVGNNK